MPLNSKLQSQVKVHSERPSGTDDFAPSSPLGWFVTNEDMLQTQYLKELITKIIRIPETGKRFFKMILNDAVRMVKS
jgi:hypothetical protein